MKPIQPASVSPLTTPVFHKTHRTGPQPGFLSEYSLKPKYLKPTLEPLGALNQIVRGASAKGVDCAGELDLSTYPF